MSTAQRSRSAITNVERYAETTYTAAELYNRGDYSAAVERLEDMARVNPNNIKVHEVLADAYLQSGRVELAEHEKAESVLTRYTERLVALREQEAAGE